MVVQDEKSQVKKQVLNFQNRPYIHKVNLGKFIHLSVQLSFIWQESEGKVGLHP